MNKLDYCENVLKNLLEEYFDKVSNCDEFAEYAKRVIIILEHDIYNQQMLMDTINSLNCLIVQCEEKRIKSEEEIFCDKDGKKLEKKLKEMSNVEILKYFNKSERVYGIHKRLTLLEEMLDLLD